MSLTSESEFRKSVRKQPLSGHREDSDVKTCSKLCVTVKLLALEKNNW